MLRQIQLHASSKKLITGSKLFVFKPFTRICAKYFAPLESNAAPFNLYIINFFTYFGLSSKFLQIPINKNSNILFVSLKGRLISKFDIFTYSS